MKKSLPSLNAIRVFDSAARHLSFTKAGAELFVTQGAVSKQINLLEAQLDCRLFARKGPYLSLTQHGEQFLESVTAALDIINHGVDSLRRQSNTTLTVSVLPSFASNWLLPRLGQFETKHPNLSVRLASSYSNVDFAVKVDIDAGIRLGNGQWDSLFCQQLTQDRMFPVCTPALAKGIDKIADLRSHTVLIDSLPYDKWANWFEGAGQAYAVKNTKYYDDTGTQIRAAIEAQGICLVREELVQDHLESGILVRPFDIEYFSDLHYYFVCLETRKDESKIALFRAWLAEVDTR